MRKLSTTPRVSAIASLAVACLWAGAAFAGTGDASFPLYVRPGPVSPLRYCQLSVALSVTSPTLGCAGGVPKGATYALICNEGADAVRWLDTGQTITTTFGQILGAGTVTLPTCGATCGAYSTNLQALQFIAETSAAVVDITFYQ
jgi:hypothetical protein